MNNYSVLFFEGCERCKQFDSNYQHRNCSFDIVREEGKTIQTYECAKCSFKWTKEFIYENSSNN